MYLLDSNICIAIINKNSQVLTQFYSIFSQCYISSIVLAELYKGAYCSQKLRENIHEINQFTSFITVVNFDHNAAKEFGKIQAELRQLG